MQFSQLTASSSLHWNVESALLEENEKVAEVELVIEGGVESIVVCGKVVSMVQVQVASEASVLPA